MINRHVRQVRHVLRQVEGEISGGDLPQIGLGGDDGGQHVGAQLRRKLVPVESGGIERVAVGISGQA